MNAFRTKRSFLLVSASLVSLFLIFGCCKRFPLVAEPIPHRTNPQGAVISIHLNAKGNIFIADQDGSPVPYDLMPLSSLLKTTYKKQQAKKETGWVQLLGSFTLFQIKENRQAILCDEKYQCVDGIVSDSAEEALFSINYDNVSSKLFIADANGERVETVENDIASMKNESGPNYMMAEKMGAERLQPFSQLIEKIDLTSADKIKTLGTFLVFKLTGCIPIAITVQPTGYTYVTCYDEHTRKTCSPIGGHCPDHCPQ